VLVIGGLQCGNGCNELESVEHILMGNDDDNCLEVRPFPVGMYGGTAAFVDNKVAPASGPSFASIAFKFYRLSYVAGCMTMVSTLTSAMD